MKLRMETGNFNIVLDDNGQCYLPKGLTADDFLGVVVIDEARHDVIIRATGHTAETKATSYEYNPVTGLFRLPD